ncbi:MAG: P1 family peptidase [Caldilineaceae bacterium]|nr:P1 family peptidase [Caldilineaceae bacterium]
MTSIPIPPSYFQLPSGPHNAITDVAGVRVGHATLIRGEGALTPGAGPVRTGVTVILPHSGNLFRNKVRAAVHTINGFGKACGFEEVRELGVIEAPIALTNTLNVWRVADALAGVMVEQNPAIGVNTSSVNVVVGECNDGYLNDIQGRHVHAEHVLAALDAAAGGPVAQGNVGAGTGTSCFGWKGGMGTASRVVSVGNERWTLGALLQTNFGRPGELMIAGAPVGRDLRPPDSPPAASEIDVEGPERGSVMIVLATDAPLSARQLRRLCVRAGAGLARTGSRLGHGSGDFVIAFTTAYGIPHRLDDEEEPLVIQGPILNDEPRAMHHFFPAVVEAVEEAVLNSLFAAETMTGRDGHVRYGLIG